MGFRLEEGPVNEDAVTYLEADAFLEEYWYV
jgi:hypothetical protein